MKAIPLGCSLWDGRSRDDGLTAWHCGRGTVDDQLFMRFTQIDPSDAEKEYSLVIDISKGKDITGEVTRTFPSFSMVAG